MDDVLRRLEQGTIKPAVAAGARVLRDAARQYGRRLFLRSGLWRQPRHDRLANGRLSRGLCTISPISSTPTTTASRASRSAWRTSRHGMITSPATSTNRTQMAVRMKHSRRGARWAAASRRPSSARSSPRRVISSSRSSAGRCARPCPTSSLRPCTTSSNMTFATHCWRTIGPDADVPQFPGSAGRCPCGSLARSCRAKAWAADGALERPDLALSAGMVSAEKLGRRALRQEFSQPDESPSRTGASPTRNSSPTTPSSNRSAAPAGCTGNLKGQHRPAAILSRGRGASPIPNPPMKQSLLGHAVPSRPRSARLHPVPGAVIERHAPLHQSVRRANSSRACIAVSASPSAASTFAKASPQIGDSAVCAGEQQFRARTGLMCCAIEWDRKRSSRPASPMSTSSGREIFQPANVVALCAFAHHNPILCCIPASASPTILQTRTGTVGRNYTYQTMTGDRRLLRWRQAHQSVHGSRRARHRNRRLQQWQFRSSGSRLRRRRLHCRLPDHGPADLFASGAAGHAALGPGMEKGGRRKHYNSTVSLTHPRLVDRRTPTIISDSTRRTPMLSGSRSGMLTFDFPTTTA